MAGNEDFFDENDDFFCKFCCKVIDHSRQGSVDRHKETVTLIQNKKNPKLQKKLQTTYRQKQKNNVTGIESWIRASVSDNLPYKMIKAESFFVKTRAKSYVKAIKLFESDLALGVFMYQLVESIFIECEVQFEMQEESIYEILDGLTETFDRCEKRRFTEKVEKAAISAKTKLSKYLDNSVGVYPSLKFLKDLQFVNPNERLSGLLPQCLTFATFTMIQKTKSNSCKTSGRVTKEEYLNFHLLR